MDKKNVVDQIDFNMRSGRHCHAVSLQKEKPECVRCGSAENLLDAVEDFKRAFMLTVGGKSPFAKTALARLGRAVDQAKEVFRCLRR